MTNKEFLKNMAEILNAPEAEGMQSVLGEQGLADVGNFAIRGERHLGLIHAYLLMQGYSAGGFTAEQMDIYKAGMSAVLDMIALCGNELKKNLNKH